jgi:hypothetical protein
MDAGCSTEKSLRDFHIGDYESTAICKTTSSLGILFVLVSPKALEPTHPHEASVPHGAWSGSSHFERVALIMNALFLFSLVNTTWSYETYILQQD